MTGTNAAPGGPRWLLFVHAVQLFFAVVILGLDSYGIKYIAYNALIFSLVVCLCTMAVAAYLIWTALLAPKLYNVYVALGLHVWLLIFWIVDLGLVANLASMWGSGNRCFTTVYSSYEFCYTKRDLEGRSLMKRYDTTSYQSYYGALTAGAVFAAVQLVTWALSTVFLLLTWKTNRNATATHSALPQYAPHAGTAPVPMEKYSHTHTGTATPSVQSPQPQYATPAQGHFQPQYAVDPVQRQDTVSPVSHAGAGYVSPQQTGSQYGAPQQGQHYGGANANVNASELHTNPYQPNVPELGPR